MKYAIVLTTCPDLGEAEQLVKIIMDEKLAACVQLSEIQSIYTWEEKLCNTPEIRLNIKTKASLYKPLEALIKKHHSYDVPQIVMTPIVDAYKPYSDWIDETTSDPN